MKRRIVSSAVRLVVPVVVLSSCTDAPLTEPSAVAPAVRFTIGPGLPPFDEDLALLGDLIFDDTNLSLNRNQACNTCHSAEWGFTGPDAAINLGGAVYEGSIPGAFGDRKPPSSAYSTLSPVLTRRRQGGGMWVGGNFFDGRATGERLGSAAAEQAQGPFLNPVEQALRDEACVVYRVGIAEYGDLYRQLWGNAIDAIVYPADVDRECELQGSRFPIDPENRARIQREYDNIAFSIAVYEESHNLFSSAFDASRRGLYKLSNEEQLGFALFQGKAKCARCHASSGQRPAFTDHTYDNLGIPRNPENPVYGYDPGFVDLGLGGFLATRSDWAVFAATERGKMRVPTLRNVDLRPYPEATKAYMHNGVFKSLEEVIRFYNTRDVLRTCGPGDTRADWGRIDGGCWPAPEVTANMNRTELGALGLSEVEERALVAFLRTLSDGFLPGGRGRHLTGN